MLKLTTTESSLIFDNKFCKQIDGVVMGSPLGPILADAIFVIIKNFGLMNVLLNLNL